MANRQVVYGQHFRIAVYFGQAPGFPQFGSANNGDQEACRTTAINTASTHDHDQLRSEIKYNEASIQTQWDLLQTNDPSPTVVESLARPVYIDWNNWKTSCEWCLYGDAMPAKCIQRVDPFAR